MYLMTLYWYIKWSSVCPGITEEHLQDQVPSKSVKFLQLIIPKKKGVQSCIRASSCQGIINSTTSDLGLCEPCNQSKNELERLHLKSMDKASLKSSTPLVHASHKKLVWAVKNLRRKNARLLLIYMNLVSCKNQRKAKKIEQL